jgi:hypothetical protein
MRTFVSVIKRGRDCRAPARGVITLISRMAISREACAGRGAGDHLVRHRRQAQNRAA